MKTNRIWGAAIAATVLTGCATAQESPPAAPVAAISAPAEAVPVHASRDYVCPDGQLVQLVHDKPAGIMRATRGGETFTLQEQVGYNPPRFVTGSDTIVVQGDDIRLARGKEQRLVCLYAPEEPTSGTMHGTLVKLDRMALPPGTRVKVMLVDAARADAPAVEISSTVITTTGNQVPLHFVIRYDPTRIGAQASPRLQARIESPEGQLMYITDTANIVLEGGQPQADIELTLVRTAAK